jgi:hypothetical protein
MSYYGIRPINRSCGSYGCHCPPNDGRQNTADMPDTTPWRDRGDYYILPKDDPVAALNILREAAGLDDWSLVDSGEAR